MTIQTLKKTPLLLCAGAMMIFTSCNSNETETETTESTNETKTEEPRALLDENSGDQENDVNEAAPVNMSSGGETAVQLNPPHGEPGHDCAIQVGAPLNPSPGIVTPSVNNNSSQENLNPPHGQPGHDCAVAVGAPLN